MQRRSSHNIQSPSMNENLIINEKPINHKMPPQNKTNPMKSGKFKRFKIPPDLQMCHVHQQATTFGRDSKSNAQFCPCCHQLLKEQIRYSQANDRNISQINEPVGFYFSFIKMMLFGLLFVIVFPGIYTIVQVSSGCEKGKIQCNYIYGVTFPEISVFYTWVSLGLNAAIMVVLYVLIAFLYYWNVLSHQKILYSNIKASETHTFLTGINHAKVTKELLLNTLKDYEVLQIIYTYKIKDIMNFIVQKGRLQAERDKYIRQGRVDKANKLRPRIKELDDKIIPIKNKFQLGQQWQMRTDKVFIKFKTKRDKYRFEENYKQSMLQNICNMICNKDSALMINYCKIYVEMLGDPRQIVWQNLQISSKRRYITIFINNLTMLVLLVLSFYFVVQLTFGEQQYKAAADIALSVTFSIIVEVINFALGIYIDLTTHFQGRYTLTGQTEIRIIKQTIVFFLNTTLIPFSLLIIESDRVTSTEDAIRNILTLILLCNIISPIISQYLQVAYLLKVFNRYRIKKAGNKCLQTQIKANEIFQKIDFNLQSRYGFLFQRLSNCYFYAGIFPIGAIITAIGLIITYFIAKKQLISLCSIPRHSFRLGILITNMAALLPFIYCLGTVLNLFTYNNDQAENGFYSILLAAISAFISLIFILKGHNLAKNFVKPSDIEASKINSGIEVEYKDLNPATFLLGTQDDASSVGSSKLLMNMMRFSVLKDAIGMQRCFDRNSYCSQIKQLEKEYEQQQ